MGVKVVAVNKEAVKVTIIIIARPPKITPTTPGINNNGINTTTVVKVDADTERNISEVPKIAASEGRLPFSSLLKILSTMTIALSTTIPVAIAKEDKLIVLIVPLLKNK